VFQVPPDGVQGDAELLGQFADGGLAAALDEPGEVRTATGR
jgi:hypothetical protein